MATSTLQTNSKNDLFLPDGRNISIITGVTALAQVCRSSGLMRLEEDIFDLTKGVDYLGKIFGATPDLDSARVSLSNAITSHVDVLSIQSLSMGLNGNTLEWVAQILTIYGTVEVSSQ